MRAAFDVCESTNPEAADTLRAGVTGASVSSVNVRSKVPTLPAVSRARKWITYAAVGGAVASAVVGRTRCAVGVDGDRDGARIPPPR